MDATIYILKCSIRVLIFMSCISFSVYKDGKNIKFWLIKLSRVLDYKISFLA